MLMREYFRWENLRKEFNRKNLKLLLYCLMASVMVTISVEMLSRRSIDETISFFVTRFPAFAYNVLVVFFTMSIALLFRRRSFALLVAGGTWVGVAIANCILLSYRSSPLTAPDIWLLASIRDIFDKYMSYFELGILMFLIAVAIAIIIYILYKTKKYPRIYAFAFTNFIITLLLLIVATVTFQNIGWIHKTTQFHNLPRAYRENGFCYCFGASLLTGGVSEPEEYSPESVMEILNGIDLPETAEDTPNIVFVQLESFFDPNYMKNLTFEENPVPNFQALREKYSGGLFSAPSIGAGTINTEFEVLTGMNLSHFGVGEYPHQSIIDSQSPETIAYSLKNIGYRTHAIHNNNATFYNRDILYANLSFDTFTSIEYMDLDLEKDYTPTQWAKDACLTQEIVKCLDATDEKDFVFTVSVQPHGRYPSEYIEGYGYLGVDGMKDEGREIGFEYYLYQLKQTDAFIGDLVETLSTYDEKTIVVFYGDHMPSFKIQNDELSYGDEQTTEYIIWANYALVAQKRDLQAYQLAAYVMDLCDIHEGVIFRLHQDRNYAGDDNETFQTALQMLEYDMLGDDGEQVCLNGHPIEPTQLRFDVEDVLVERVAEDATKENCFHVYGQNFTQYSVVCINDEPYITRFVSKEELIVENVEPATWDEWSVAQLSAADDMEILSQSEAIVREG